MMKRVVLFALFNLLICFLVEAQNTWTGAVNNRWDNTGNWSYGYIPIAEEDVRIDLGAKVIIPSGYTATCEDLIIGLQGSTFGDTLIIRNNAILNANGISQYDRDGLVANEGTISTSTTIFLFDGKWINEWAGLLLIPNWHKAHQSKCKSTSLNINQQQFTIPIIID